MEKINRVAIVGGTHGNEFTGIYLIKKWKKKELIRRATFETLTLIGNPRAFQKVQRYLDRDLNRCFVSNILNAAPSSLYEENRARKINQIIGPKGNSKSDFILDLHSTAANVGLSIVLTSNDLFSRKIAAYLNLRDPSIKIYSHVELKQESPFLNSISEKGFAIESGPVIPGTLHANLFQKTEALVYAILDYIEKYNRGEFQKVNRLIEIYHYFRDIPYPKSESGEIEAMVHPNLQNKDYEELNKGDPLFLTFDGKIIAYQEKETVWPVFINTPAYNEKDIAMRLTKKQRSYA